MSSRPTYAMLAISLALHAAAGGALLALGKGPSKEADALPPPAAAGETFEVPEVDHASSNEPAGAAPAQTHPAAPVHAQRRQDSEAPRAANAGPSSSSSASEGGEGKSALFGAVGERGVFDLATAFTRAFPQAASADPVWIRTPLGPAGSADVSLEIDSAGQLIDTRVSGSLSPALRQGIDRTIILIRTRTFVSTAAVTRLHVVGTISPDTVHDDLHGEVFAIGGSFSGREGNAFFALAIGRRIDLNITRR